MSLSSEFRQATNDGTCVCDLDVLCPIHPSTSCGLCEYACHCDEHGYRDEGCEDFVCPRCSLTLEATGQTYGDGVIAGCSGPLDPGTLPHLFLIRNNRIVGTWVN